MIIPVNASRMTNPIGAIWTAVYDGGGRLSASVDPLGNRTSFGYDAVNRPVSATDPLGNVNSAVYDAASRLVASVDPLGNTNELRVRRGQPARQPDRSTWQHIVKCI